MEVPDVQIPKSRETYTYPCKYCGYECRKQFISGSDVPLTKTGSYGTGTPSPVTCADEMYSTLTVSFTAASGSDPAYLSDNEYRFGDKHFSDGMTIRISTTSGTNDGDYTIATRGVTRGTILLSSSDSLTTESAATAGTTVISRIIYKPSVTSGCPLCGSLNSR